MWATGAIYFKQGSQVMQGSNCCLSQSAQITKRLTGAYFFYICTHIISL